MVLGFCPWGILGDGAAAYVQWEGNAWGPPNVPINQAPDSLALNSCTTSLPPMGTPQGEGHWALLPLMLL